MQKDKYSAVWVSHSSISDFLKCPRAYYLRNVYKDRETGHKITIINPSLALGSAVHEVVESLSSLPTGDRLAIPLVKKFDIVWLKYTGKKGGFRNHSEELEFRDRGIAMLRNIQENPGPILRKAIKIKSKINLPNYWLSEEENVILCGKIDWLEYIEDIDSVHIIDFKTGKNEEKEDSLQLPIYLLLATNTQSKKVAKASYWYLDKNTELTGKELPAYGQSFNEVLEIAQKIKLARLKGIFQCPKDGCFFCRPYENLIKGKGEKVGVSETRQDIYVLRDI